LQTFNYFIFAFYEPISRVANNGGFGSIAQPKCTEFKFKKRRHHIV